MIYYHATIEQLEKILTVASVALTPGLLITLDDTNKDDLSAKLIHINQLVANTTRFISEIAFIGRDGTSLAKDDESLRELLTTFTQSLKKKCDQQIRIKENVKSQPIGPYSDFFRSKENPHNTFGCAFPESEIQGLTIAKETSDTSLKHVFVDTKTDSVAILKFL